MASLIRQSGDDPGDVIHLKPGVNRFGTGEKCDFIVDHSSVSKAHCDLIVDEEGLTVRDLDSENGTFVDESPVAESKVLIGQTIRMGEVRLLVADDKLQSAKSTQELRSAAVEVRYCQQHPDAEVAFQCPQCGAVMCIHCVRVLKVHQGHGLCLCPHCSHECESLIAKDTHELEQVINQLVMVRRAFAPRPHRPAPPTPSDSV
ncbi:MAG: FHA domain-containing protein [Verrucomicrobia bacterium]|jgi:transcription elongation factor Elf1|nr:FHA domain-containing protein [Verrucomicrobiota bacterium]